MTDPQQQTIDWLCAPANHGGETVTHVQTHGAHVFLSGDEAWKIKRAVTYDYMDFSTLLRRRAMLERELSLNAGAAPGIYRDVVALSRAAGGELELDGPGPAVEWVLRMKRFPQEDELSEIADRGALDDQLSIALGESVRAYHEAAPQRAADGPKLICDIIDELTAAFAGMTEELGADRVRSFDIPARAALAAVAPLLTQRAQAGAVRRCHGDLHLRNLVLLDGRPVPFDALEFDEVLGTCDVLYDLAFLVMDLRHRGLTRAACMTLDAWLFAAKGSEDAGSAALPLFLGIRAAIRAMVEIQTARATRGASGHIDAAQGFLDDALADFTPQPPMLLAVGGMSGVGKTTLARDLATLVGPSPGAVHLRSDLERKALAGVQPLDHLPDDAYGAAASTAVYDQLMRRAQTLLAANRSVLLDATWLAPSERHDVETLAQRAGVPFRPLWLEADTAILQARVTDRRADASDATAEVVQRQTLQAQLPGHWLRIDASGTPEQTLLQARAALHP
ncbi:AAA family ATPase [Salipiger sp. 1_MG-2023]|uniref:bifunctional aminoglycoside phosphotransferase/ATP-binding protein n=1 Tax=Salipiger sp. 1_MG-2023 TaxID=3062665 RepID=UPI0026E3BA96|nr:bifunctional aminoglycoside phosphotransferase/ATP-binding protein [Salipiger sp. 1_MG-2023]MDO6584504.1 AAA family ATPase [Salipiger sp. 1_MG-2023]